MGDSPVASNLGDDFLPKERLRILAAEYESKGLEAQAIRERMLQLVGVAVLVMGVIASIPGLAAVESVAKSSLFWWCAPALLGALFAALVICYGNLNGLVYYRRGLEAEINEALGKRLVLRYENGFAKAFYSLHTGDRSMRVILLALLLAIAGIYIGSVALSLSGLTTAYEKASGVLQPTQRNLFIGTYAAFGLFLAYAAYRAAFYVRPLYEKAMGVNLHEQLKTAIPWRTLLVARPWEIPTKSLFFWGSYTFGVIYGGRADWVDAVVVWVCLELFVNQAKYVLNDIYDTGPDSRSCDVRDNPFKDLSPIALRLVAAGAIVKACVGSLLTYWWLGKDMPAAIGVFLLLPMQILYNRARAGFPKLAEHWLIRFRNLEKKLVLSTIGRAEAVNAVGPVGADGIPRSRDNPKWSGDEDSAWFRKTLFLALLLGAGYAIRLGIPLHLVGLSRDPLLFAGYLAWGTAFGFAFILGYWSWEGAWYAQRPASFNTDYSCVADRAYIRDVSRSKAHTLWCYRKLEEQVGKRPSLRRLPAPWEMVWSLVLLTGPVLGACTLSNFPNSRGSWALTIAGGVLCAAAYITPSVPRLRTVGRLFTALLLLYLAAAALGYRPATVPLLFVFLPSVFGLVFAAHYTAGPWSNFDQRYATGKVRERLTGWRKKLLGFLDSLLLPSGQ
jgi:hypothetical protein